MTNWRIYKHYFQFEHQVKDRPELVDKACLTQHQHGFYPNKFCEAHVCVSTPNYWLDYKTIKILTIKAFEFVSKTDSDMNPSIFLEPTSEYYYNFGIVDTETLVNKLQKLIRDYIIAHTRDNETRISIWFDETNKYSYWHQDHEDHSSTCSCNCHIEAHGS